VALLVVTFIVERLIESVIAEIALSFQRNFFLRTQKRGHFLASAVQPVFLA
jgi:hypothetical protein